MPCSHSVDPTVFQFPYDSLLGLLTHQRFHSFSEQDRQSALDHPTTLPSGRHNRMTFDQNQGDTIRDNEIDLVSSSIAEILQEALVIADRASHFMRARDGHSSRDRDHDRKNDKHGPAQPQ